MEVFMPRTFIVTPEQRQQAQETRKLNTLTRQASSLRQDFLTAPYWLELAKKYGVRLPAWGIAPTISNMRTWLHKVGISQPEYESYYNEKLGDFLVQNPEWPLRAWVGLVLELVDEIRYPTPFVESI